MPQAALGHVVVGVERAAMNKQVKRGVARALPPGFWITSR